MVRDFDASAPVGTNKVVACITAQYNSERLIDTAAEVADKFNAELHILHVEHFHQRGHSGHARQTF